jgi:predicted DNA-binding transcriptional regulator YafY
MIQILRDGRLHRAQDVADRMGVSLRTVYRDMDTLMASGVPVEGTRGLGYQITAAVTLPPLNLTLTEFEAMHLGLAVVSDGADDELKAAAAALADKIDAVLPEDPAARPKGWGLATYPLADAARGFRHMPLIRNAIRTKQKLSVVLREDTGARLIRPLKMEYWGRLWTVTVWDESVTGFQTMRIDLIETLRIMPQLFTDEPGKTLVDHLNMQDQ